MGDAQDTEVWMYRNECTLLQDEIIVAYVVVLYQQWNGVEWKHSLVVCQKTRSIREVLIPIGYVKLR